jgi:Arc/MetJ-type ribon-helix-helix transcriptional regulator
LRAGGFESAGDVVERAVEFFLNFDDGVLDQERAERTRVAVAEGLAQAERGEGLDLAEFDEAMRAKYGVSR